MTLESAALACSRSTPPGFLSSALVDSEQVKTNLNQYVCLRAQAVLRWCDPLPDTPHRRDVGLIARSIVARLGADGIHRAVDYAQHGIAERCTGHAGNPMSRR